ncbi:unnamed protein product [Hermetia illucens]|uniref:Uncharacterized protein n=1 Tax=Hermetia illucens TaxID=343691 RepID=A0A7R8UFW1_HERIL|nr:unnamed protein product [Hermetia illucens]
MKFLSVFLFAVILAEGYAEIRCYQCQNCSKIPENSIVTCGSGTTVTPSPTGSSPGSTSSSSSTSPASSSPTTPLYHYSPSTTTPSGTPSETSEVTDSFAHPRFARATEAYSCYVVEYKVDNVTYVDRGCTDNKDLCKLAENVTDKCRICSDNECNSTSTLQISVFILLTTLAVAFASFR